MTPVEAALGEALAAAPGVVFLSLAVFARVAAATFLVPGLGEQAVPVRIRLGVALAIAWLVLPLVLPLAGGLPRDPAGLALLLVGEAAAGLLIGLAFRVLVFVLQIAGVVAAQNITISHMFGGGVAPEPEPTIATLLGLGGIALALMAGLHIRFVAGFAALYDVLPFGVALPAGDAARFTVSRVAEAFAAGLGLAAPFIAVGFAYNLALGALSRAMPQLLVALVGVPALVGLGIVTLWLVLPEIYGRWGRMLADIAADPLALVR